MSGFTSFGSSIGNFSTPGEERIGFSDTSTALVSLAAAGSTNTKGSWTTVGTASGALFHGVVIVIGNPSATGAGYAIDISFDNDVTTVIPNLYAVGANNNEVYVYLPLNIQTVSTASYVRARVASTTANATLEIGIIGLLDNDNQTRPLWNTMTAETFYTTDTSPSSVAIAVGSGSGAYSTIVASTSATYDCILPCAAAGSTGGATGAVGFQTVTYAVGGSGSEVIIAVRPLQRSTANPFLANPYPGMLYVSIPSGSTVRAKANGPTPNTSTLRVGFYGFS